MSGSTIGGVVGGVIGFVASGFNPAGFQWGFMIGSAVGGYVDPMKVEGPRLRDATRQTSQDGIPIPFGYGTFPTAGNVIWTDELKEHEKEEGGKGGPEVTTYTYTRSYAIGICEGPIAGLLLIKRNGKVVWDAREPDTLREWMQDVPDYGTGGGMIGNMGVYDFWRHAIAWSQRFARKATFYLGDESQMPDPTIEAVEGVGDVPAHRGMAYMVVKDDDLTDMQGAIPQYEFVVATAGAADPHVCDLQALWASKDDGDVLIGSETGDAWDKTSASGVGNSPALMFAGGGRVLVIRNGAGRVTATNGTAWEDITGLPSSDPGGGVYCEYTQRWFVVYPGQVYVSLDGRTFAPGPSVPMATYFNGVARGATVMFGSTNGGVLVSFDGGDSFARITAMSGTTNGIPHLAVSPVGFVAFANNGSRAAWSPDGSPGSWTSSTLPAFGAVAGAAGGVTGAVVAVDVSGKTIVSNDGGQSFTPGQDCGLSLAYIAGGRRVIYTAGRFFAGGGMSKIAVLPEADMAGAWSLVHSPAAGSSIKALVANDMATGLEVPDAPGYYIGPDGRIVTNCRGGTVTLATTLLSGVVADLCRRAGLSPDEYDVSGLTDTVHGYRVATEGGADSMIGPLMGAFFFDAGEWDGKLRFVKRGGNATFSIGLDDLAERDGDAVMLERVQEAELLRRVTVGYIDPMTAYSVTTQKWERRAGTIDAKGEATSEVPVVLSADQAAQVAERKGKIAWSETEKALFSLPALRWARLTPTDVGEIHLPDGDVMRVRVASREEDSGALLIEASRDRQAAYRATSTGVRPPPPRLTDPPLIGPTQLAVMNLPVLRDEDDDLGVYVAARGMLPGWKGAMLQFSADGGATFTDAAEIRGAAKMGTTVSGIAAWHSPDYPSPQALTVTLSATPPSLDYASLLRYGNRAAVETAEGWEVLQFQTVTTNTDGRFTLSGLVRGRYNTTPAAIAAGARFVLIDSAVQFVKVPAHMVGQAILVRAVPFGIDPDAITATAYTLADPASVREWPVAGIAAVRDGAAVTVTWIPRPRIGVEVAPMQSRLFVGYRVSFSDGHTADVTTTSYVRADTPPDVTVSVAPMNSITGAGPFSEAVSV